VHVLAESRDPLLQQHLVDPALVDVGDQEPRRVRPEIDSRDPRHLRG
jgi:hypothetical protein